MRIRATHYWRLLLILFLIGGCRTRIDEGRFRSQSQLQTFEVVPNLARLDDVLIPSFPLRVAAKYVLSGIRLDGAPASPELKYARFMQMLEYLDRYAQLSPAPLKSNASQAMASLTYRDWLQAEHRNLPPFASFEREMLFLVKNLDKLDPATAQDEVIAPQLGRAERPAVGSEAYRVMEKSRRHMTEWMRAARLNEKTAELLSAAALRSPREIQKGVHVALQMIGLSALVKPLFQVSDLALDSLEHGLTATIATLTPEFTLEDAENMLFELARLRGLISLQPDWVVSVMTEAEKAMRSTKASAEELVKSQIDSGYFQTADPSASLLLSLMIGGYIKSLPEAQAKNIFSDLIDAASPELRQQDVLGAALRNSGPLAKKTLQLFADAEGLTTEAKSVLNDLLANNEAMDFSLVTQTLADREASSLKIVRVYERPLGVGSLADVYRIDVQQNAPFLTAESSEQDSGSSALTADSIEQEWHAQACLAAAQGQALTGVLKALSSKPKATAADVIAVCKENGLDAQTLIQNDSTPQWIREAAQSKTIPLAVRILKPETASYLAQEQAVMKEIIEKYDRAMDADEREQLAQKNHISTFHPRLGNMLQTYVDLIKEELNTGLTLKRQRLAAQKTSSYESIVADPSKQYLLRTRVPRIAQLPLSNQSQMKGNALVQEFLPGADFVHMAEQHQLAPLTRKRTAGELLKIWLRGALYDDTRLVHADLHRGNILTDALGTTRSSGSATRSIIQASLIDFGMAVETTGSETTDFSYDIINLGIGVYRRDVDRVLHSLRSLADLSHMQNSPANHADQRTYAQAFLKSYKDPDGNNSPPPLDAWFSWAKDKLPPPLRLQFPTHVLNLIRGYLTVKALHSNEGATDWDTLRINIELALKPGNLAKIWQAYRKSNSLENGTHSKSFRTEEALAEELRTMDGK